EEFEMADTVSAAQRRVRIAVIALGTVARLRVAEHEQPRTLQPSWSTELAGYAIEVMLRRYGPQIRRTTWPAPDRVGAFPELAGRLRAGGVEHFERGHGVEGIDGRWSAFREAPGHAGVERRIRARLRRHFALLFADGEAAPALARLVAEAGV